MVQFKKSKIIVVGDLMLDQYLYGSVERICPEAPVPILKFASDEMFIGGAGLVASTLKSLGMEPAFISVIGDDYQGQSLVKIIGKEGIKIGDLFIEEGRKTTLKMRFMTKAPYLHMLLRMDDEVIAPITSETEDAVLEAFKEELPSADLVVISDYMKGVLTHKVISGIMKAAAAAGKKVIVDSKMELERYKGAYLAVPNAKEISLEFGVEYSNEDETIIPLAKKLASGLSETVIVKRGDRGATLVEKGVDKTIKSKAQKVVNVSGAGDIFVAIIAVCICSGIPLEKAVELANEGCAIAIGKNRPKISASELQSQPPAQSADSKQ
ncbi:MAG: bifunctional ADP-heptose synthase [Candidatus Micrarchaeota archaeon]|nr:bifunctional ADP-heptose synthase [Candidatus Micrarchaeota archaeon]